MLTPERLVAILDGLASQHGKGLMAFWYKVSSNREQFRTEIVKLRKKLRLVPMVIRGEGFLNPNALATDICRAIESHREEFESEWFRGHPPGSPILLLLLGRTELSIPQMSSPAVLPQWFPEWGGRTVQITVQDLTHTAKGPLNIPEGQIDEVCVELYDLENALLARLTAVAEEDHNAGNALFEVIRDPKVEKEKYKDFLTKASRNLAAVHNRSGFRPSARDGQSLVGRLMRLASSSSPDQLPKRGIGLAKALGLTDKELLGIDDPITGVLLRPVNREEANERCCRNMVVAIYAAAQLVTAAAHADDYPGYPVELIRHVSYDLRRFLSSATAAIISLEGTA